MSSHPSKGFHLVTPLVHSPELSKVMGRKGIRPDIQTLTEMIPPGSFKIRGIGRTCEEAVAAGATRLVGSSGGNAGLAMAYAATKLGVDLSLFVPETAPKVILDKLRGYPNVDLNVSGRNWDAADALAKELLAKEANSVFIHPFSQPSTWAGHSTVVEEIRDQLAEQHEDAAPAAVVTCVGGGGLAIGIIQGLQSVGWSSVPLITMETEGADCLNKAVEAGSVVRLGEISSIAKSLGALSVSERLLELTKEHKVISKVVPDQVALKSCFRFAADHRMLVEPACGAALSAVYEKLDLDISAQGPVVVIVCGGSMATFGLFEQWADQLGVEYNS